jgi:glycosyltransferase involved in cell wall biosynthesis
MNPPVAPKKKIVMLGASLQAPGGMTSVVVTLMNAGLFRKFNVDYISTYERTGLRWQLRTMLRALVRMLRLLLTRQVALVHAHSASRGSFVRKSLLCALARGAGVPYVLHIHSGEFPVFYGTECNALAKWWVRYTLRHAATVVCLTETWRTHLQAVEPRARAAVIGNPVEIPPALPPSRDTVIEVLFLGRLREQKGVFDLLRALPQVLQRCPQMRFVLAGDEGIDACRAYAEQLGVAHALVLPGWVSGEEKAALLRRADLFVLPSYAEGLPVGLLEAMALGIPIVTTPVGGVPDLIDDGVHGLMVAPKDAAALAAALVRLGTDCALRAALRAAAFERVQAHYALPTVLAALDRLYSELGGCAEAKAALIQGEI